jgi:ribosomal protein S18 acetylase RimI-like enzyme
VPGPRPPIEFIITFSLQPNKLQPDEAYLVMKTLHHDGIRIRRATLRDLGAMTALLAELFSLEPDFAICPDRQARGLRLLLKAARTGTANVTVAEDQASGRVVGMATVQTVVSTAEGALSGWVEDVVVTASRRGSGIGGRLLAALAAWAEARGATRLQLLADRDNRAALEFYAGHGWQRTRMTPLRIAPAAAGQH